MTSLASATNGAESAQNAYSEALRTSQLESEKLTNASNNVTAARNREQNAALATLEAEDRLARARKAGIADAEKMLILEEKVEAAKRNEENASIGVERALTAEKTAMKAATAEKERLTAAANNHRLALLREGDAQRNVGSAIRDHNREVREASNVIDSLGDSLSSMGTRAFKVTRGLGSLAVPAVVEFLIQTAEVAVTASQSIALLPAVAVAAGAGMGTLALATQGFSDAIGDIRDIEKFSQDLAKLAPNAQQTALALRNALPMFDRIQQATQDAFFSGGSGMVSNLAEAFGPDIETLTTGIATSLNGAMKSVNANLLSSNGQSDIGSIMDNIAVAFQNAAPAARSFSQVLLDITEVGSSFLPELGTGLANAASDFAAFINEARRSGDLKKWIEEGIAAVKTLGGAILDVGKFLYDTFGGASQSDLNAWRNSLDNLLTTVQLIIEAIGGPMKLLNSEIPTLHKSISDLISPFQLIANIIDGFRWFFDPNYRKSTEPLQQAATDKLNARLEELGLPKIAVGGSSAGLGPDDTDPNRFKIPEIAGAPKLGVGTGNVSIADTFMFGGKLYTKDAVKRAQKTSKQNKLSDKEQLDQIAAGLDPSTYKVDPYAPIGGLPAGPMPGGGYGPGAQNAQDILEAQHSVESQAHDLEESRMKRLALEKSGTATQKEIDDAKWKELEDGWALQKAQANLVDKQRGTTRNLKDGMDELGVALDPDLGLSKGLSGFAENMTRMLGNMLFAPIERQLQATINADPLKGGFGLLGINAAKNMSNGLSPLFGQPYGDGSGSAGIAGTGTPASNTYPGDAALLASVPKGIGHYDNATKDLSQGLVDCASGVEDLVNIMDGKSTTGGSLWTGNASSVLPGMGFQRGMGGLGDFRIGYNSGHMQATLPGGTPVNYGSTPAIQAGGLSGSQGADDPSFTDHWYRPAGATAAMPGAGGYGGMAGTGGATPVFVVNMPGGGIGSTGAGIPGAPGGGAGGAGTATPGGSGINWDAIAGAEASGNWANKSNPKYQGGLQFDPQTWAKVKPAGAPANAADASREQQIAGAEALLASGATPATQWPATYKAHPEWFSHSDANTNPGLSNPPAPPLAAPGDLFTGGGGQGPIFRKSPMSDLDPNSPTGQTGQGPMPGVPSPFPGLDPTSPFGPLSPGPGQIGPFPTPGALTGLGGVGNSSLLQPGGTGGTAGWTPQGGAPTADPTRIGGISSGGTPAMGGTGGIGASDGTMALAGMAASALDVIAPGAGQAAQTGMKLANRAIQYGSQLAGIGVSGLMETFLPTGGSELAGGGWIPRIVGGLAGAKPALPNVAGGKAGNGTNGDPGQGAPPLSPQQAQAHGGGGSPGPGNTNNVNIDYSVQNQTEDRSGKDLESHIMKGLGG